MARVSDIIFIILSTVIVYTIFLYTWVTDQDMTGLPKKPMDRFNALAYFSTSTLSSIGYGDIVPVSNRARFAVSGFMIFTYIASIIGLAQTIKTLQI